MVLKKRTFRAESVWQLMGRNYTFVDAAAPALFWTPDVYVVSVLLGMLDRLSRMRAVRALARSNGCYSGPMHEV